MKRETNEFENKAVKAAGSVEDESVKKCVEALEQAIASEQELEHRFEREGMPGMTDPECSQDGLVSGIEPNEEAVCIIGKNGSCKAAELVIPSWYKGFPVTTVSIVDLGPVRSMRLGKNIQRISYDHIGHNGSDAGPYEYSLQSVTVDEENPYLKSDGTALYSKDGKVLLQVVCMDQIEEYEVLFGTQTIAAGAFASAENYGLPTFGSLKKVILPDSVEVIEAGAFVNDPVLEEVIGLEHVKAVADDAFEGTPFEKKRK